MFAYLLGMYVYCMRVSIYVCVCVCSCVNIVDAVEKIPFGKLANTFQWTVWVDCFTIAAATIIIACTSRCLPFRFVVAGGITSKGFRKSGI